MSRPRFCFQWWRSFILAWSGSFPVWCCERVAGYSSLRGRKRRCNLPASVMVAEQAFMLELSSGCRAGLGRAGPGDQLREAGTHSEILMTYWREGLNLPLVISPSLPPLIYLPAAPSLSLFLSPLLFVYLSLPLPPPLSPSLSLRRVVRLCYVILKRQERCKVKNTT